MQVDRYGWDSAEILFQVTLPHVRGVRGKQRWGLIFQKLFFNIYIFLFLNNIFFLYQMSYKKVSEYTKR